ncbi:MAG: 2-oxoacid:acceptor oxidoreductase family protein [Planctomycetes bacterium]|nr:2-oxoacid:acceptor oxidoreductase family protein [Planctomycetota bacterium]
MSTTEIKIGGLGGQGVIMAGMIIGRGASIYDNKHASLTQSFGPEARGSACSAQLIVSDEPIEYPYVTHPNILVAMSQEACNRFLPEIADAGTFIYEEELVKPGKVNSNITSYGIPTTRIAEELKRRMVANIVMVGFFAAVTSIVQVEALRLSVKASVPAGTSTQNLAAFDHGYDFGVKLLGAGRGATAASAT